MRSSVSSVGEVVVLGRSGVAERQHGHGLLSGAVVPASGDMRRRGARAARGERGRRARTSVIGARARATIVLRRVAKPVLAAARHALEHEPRASASGQLGARALRIAAVGERARAAATASGDSPGQARLPREQLVEQRAERVDVGARVDVALPLDLLGRHVRGRAHERAPSCCRRPRR